MLSILDVLLVFSGLVLFAWGIYRQTVGMLLTWVCFWVSVVVAGAVVLMVGSAHGFGASIQQALWGNALSIRLLQVVLFLFLGMTVFVILHLLVHLVAPNPGIPKLGLGDNILGGLLGILLGIAWMALMGNLWRIAVSVSWRPYDLWQSMQIAYRGSFLVPYVRLALPAVGKLFFPFVFTGYPVVLIP